MSLNDGLRYWNTLRYLRPSQVLGRIWFRTVRPAADLRPAPSLRALTADWTESAERAPSMTGPARFEFLNQFGEIRDAESWNDDVRDKLWLYNLHYFDDLAAEDWQARETWHRNIVARWMRENPPPFGVGWDPYPTSLRIVNWIKWAAAGNSPSSAQVHSLAVQARWLAGRVEHHLGANHLLANATALVFAGVYFDGPEADHWRAAGIRLLQRELPEQILSDGGHYERSPMYHALILEHLLDLINAGRAWSGALDERVVLNWRWTASRMFGWLRAMSHPDGQISFFNDAAFGIAAHPAALGRYAARLRVDVPAVPVSLSDSGYVRAERATAVLIADVASVGPDHQPAHAHADTLSFECSLDGHRVFVNTGTSTYEPGARRRFERSTAAHNTLEIEGGDSSEVWSAFRVARRARPREAEIADSDDGVRIRGAHDGYRRLPGKPLHVREWRLTANRLTITDRYTGQPCRAVARFYLHPAVNPLGMMLELPNGRRCRLSVSGGDSRFVPTSWRPEFGRDEANQCLEVTLSGNELVVGIDW